jgi:hypothetical protein
MSAEYDQAFQLFQAKVKSTLDIDVPTPADLLGLGGAILTKALQNFGALQQALDTAGNLRETQTATKAALDFMIDIHEIALYMHMIILRTSSVRRSLGA